MEITNEIKQQISIKLNDYLKEFNLSQNEFSEATKINGRYISAIVNGETYTGSTAISDKYYKQVAKAIYFPLTRDYWETKPTAQMYRQLETLQDARELCRCNVIIGETGCGKSYVTNLFMQKFPTDTYKVTVGSLDSIGDLLDKVLDVLNINSPKSKSKKITEIARFLEKKQFQGAKPILIFDECEYMKQPALCSMKELYDNLIGVCGLVLIGTDQLIENVERMSKKNRAGIPQFYRRIKHGIRVLDSIDRKYPLFLDDIEDVDLKKWLINNCANYGELHDVLVPAKMEAERLKLPLNLDLVRTMLGNPLM